MGLLALEFSDCYLDSPQLRDRIRAHEAELDRTNKFIKELLKDGKTLIAATKNLSAAQRKFAHSLRDFKFEFIGDAETDDERCIDASLHEFSNFLKNLEEQREILALSVTETLIKPLERFRKEQLGAVKEEKKKFDKETEKNYSLIEKHLSLSAKKKELQLQEADSQVEQNRKHFYEVSLEYVCKLQEIQERKTFECVEPVLSFFQGLFTFYHQGYELAKDFNHYKMDLQINIQNTRNRFEGTRSEVEELMNKIKRNPQEHKRADQATMEGYLYVQEKRPAPFGSSWVKHYCTYKKQTKTFSMIPFEHRSGGKAGDLEAFFLTYCTKRNTDTIDRRFCFDMEAADRPGIPVTMQAFSEDERKLWVEALDSKGGLFINLNRPNTRREGSAQLDKIGFTIIRKCISAIETRGINDQGLYRVVGVSSKVQRLLNLLMDAKTCNEVDLENSVEWEVKTITSAMKQYLRSLPEPLMTYELHGEFIVPAKSGSPESRVSAIHFLVHKLPEKNKEMLDILVKHLANVSNHAKKNLMTVANLGVVFGPTLMRPQEETVAAIMDLKFQNIVVEILIENHEKIFRTLPDATFPEPISVSISPPNAPPRQSRRQGQRNKRPVAVYNLCLDLDDGDSHSSPKEDTPTGSMDSLSSQSPTPAISSSPSGPDKNHLILDSGDGGEWATNHPNLTRSSMVSWMNTPSTTTATSATATATAAPSSIPFPTPTTASDRPAESVVPRKARAVYPCEAEHSSELSFRVGAIFEDADKRGQGPVPHHPIHQQFPHEENVFVGCVSFQRAALETDHV
ncbi:rho GTPase-activating protein 10 isoform X1 [Alligator sinensis]|uniref:Rho GTPase-activating protein 10 n=1 Tax=Alligator sinensis TaxID=38654 RepID=A0A1U7RHZ5_ALLSI|nr:rho GTPase-activating protein 10 isoform X1 [Alligator sinensis]XP_025060092.1 rho GTPase-activating protein 10 isoform X1 [Alligator sinensis]